MAEDAVVEVKAAPKAKVAKAKVASNVCLCLCSLLSALCSMLSALCPLLSALYPLLSALCLSVVSISIADETKVDWRPTV
jgi:hypothetical protein